MTEGFATRVATAVAATGPMCAGIDPSAELLGAWGLADTPEGLRSFGLSCVEAFAGVVPVVKPQVAFFERLGSGGVAALEEVLAAARTPDCSPSPTPSGATSGRPWTPMRRPGSIRPARWSPMP